MMGKRRRRKSVKDKNQTARTNGENSNAQGVEQQIQQTPNKPQAVPTMASLLKLEKSSRKRAAKKWHNKYKRKIMLSALNPEQLMPILPPQSSLEVDPKNLTRTTSHNYSTRVVLLNLDPVGPKLDRNDREFRIPLPPCSNTSLISNAEVSESSHTATATSSSTLGANKRYEGMTQLLVAPHESEAYVEGKPHTPKTFQENLSLSEILKPFHADVVNEKVSQIDERLSKNLTHEEDCQDLPIYTDCGTELQIQNFPASRISAIENKNSGSRTKVETNSKILDASKELPISLDFINEKQRDGIEPVTNVQDLQKSVVKDSVVSDESQKNFSVESNSVVAINDNKSAMDTFSKRENYGHANDTLNSDSTEEENQNVRATTLACEKESADFPVVLDSLNGKETQESALCSDSDANKTIECQNEKEKKSFLPGIDLTNNGNIEDADLSITGTVTKTGNMNFMGSVSVCEEGSQNSPMEVDSDFVNDKECQTSSINTYINNDKEGLSSSMELDVVNGKECQILSVEMDVVNDEECPSSSMGIDLVNGKDGQISINSDINNEKEFRSSSMEECRISSVKLGKGKEQGIQILSADVHVVNDRERQNFSMAADLVNDQECQNSQMDTDFVNNQELQSSSIDSNFVIDKESERNLQVIPCEKEDFIEKDRMDLSVDVICTSEKDSQDSVTGGMAFSESEIEQGSMGHQGGESDMNEMCEINADLNNTIRVDTNDYQLNAETAVFENSSFAVMVDESNRNNAASSNISFIENNINETEGFEYSTRANNGNESEINVMHTIADRGLLMSFKPHCSYDLDASYSRDEERKALESKSSTSCIVENLDDEFNVSTLINEQQEFSNDEEMRMSDFGIGNALSYVSEGCHSVVFTDTETNFCNVNVTAAAKSFGDGQGHDLLPSEFTFQSDEDICNQSQERVSVVLDSYASQSTISQTFELSD